MKATANVNGNVQIAAIGGGGVDGNGNIHVEDRWYKGQEWKDLGKKGPSAAIKIRAGRKGPKKAAHQGGERSKSTKLLKGRLLHLRIK